MEVWVDDDDLVRRVRLTYPAKQYDPSRIDPPCYFNSGCCCFPDGDVTCLELDGKNISLLRWPNDEDTATPKVLATHGRLARSWPRLRPRIKGPWPEAS
jgi:hypothetical protein